MQPTTMPVFKCPCRDCDSPRDDYDRVMAINLRGVWSCMKFELQQMRKQKRTIVMSHWTKASPDRDSHAAASTMHRASRYATRGIRLRRSARDAPQSDVRHMIAEAG